MNNHRRSLRLSDAHSAGEFVQINESGVENHGQSLFRTILNQRQVGHIVSRDLQRGTAFADEEIDTFEIIHRSDKRNIESATLGKKLRVIGKRNGLSLDERAVGFDLLSRGVVERDIQSTRPQADIGIVQNLRLENGHSGRRNFLEIVTRESYVLIEVRADFRDENDRMVIANWDFSDVDSFHGLRCFEARCSAISHWCGWSRSIARSGGSGNPRMGAA